MANRTKVLHVDDDEHVLRTVARLLQGAGFAVVSTTSPFIAPIIQREKPDVIVMDVRLPDMRGTEAAVILRTDPETRDIPIVFVTASVMAEGRKELEAVANAGFIGKPINTRTFASEIGKFIR